MYFEKDSAGEIRDRVRRIETRVTKLCLRMGVDAGATKPSWSDGQIDIPSKDVSIRDVISVVPADWPKNQKIELRISEDQILSFHLPLNCGAHH
jgi:hypothetical protein